MEWEVSIVKGILDRFEENKAVILIEDQKEEIIVDKDILPENSDVSTWFDIKKQGGSYNLIIDPDLTHEKKQKATDLRAKLKAKSSGSKFKKK